MRLLHTMLRVGDLERSLAFYTEVLGMRELRREDYPDGRFTLAFVGYQDEAEGADRVPEKERATHQRIERKRGQPEHAGNANKGA